MRDKLIHGYDMVDLDQFWQTVIEDVPDLLSSIVLFYRGMNKVEAGAKKCFLALLRFNN